MITTQPSLASYQVMKQPARVTQASYQHHTDMRNVTLTLAGMLLMCVLIWCAMSIATFLQATNAQYNVGKFPTNEITGVYGHNDSQQDQTTLIATVTQGKLLLVEIPGSIVKDTHITPMPIVLQNAQVSDIKVDAEKDSTLQGKWLVTLTLVTGYNVPPLQQPITHVFLLADKGHGYFELVG